MNIDRHRHLAAEGDLAAAEEVLRWRARRGEGECVPPYPSTVPRLELDRYGWPTDACLNALAAWGDAYIRACLVAAGIDLGARTLHVHNRGWARSRIRGRADAEAYIYPPSGGLGALIGQATLTEDGPSWVPHPGVAPHIPRTHGLYERPIAQPDLPRALALCYLWRFQETPDQREAVEVGRCRGCHNNEMHEADPSPSRQP